MEINSFLLVALIAVVSILVGWIFTKFKLLKVNYFTHMVEDPGELMVKHPLKDLKSIYKKFLSLLAPLGIIWGVFGVLLVIFTSTDLPGDVLTMVNIISIWILISAVILGLVPVLIAFGLIKLPESLDNTIRSKFTLLLLSVTIIGIVTASVVLQLPSTGIIILVLLSIPAMTSAWFAGEFYAIFSIRQFFKIFGWDYIEGKRPDKPLKLYIGKLTGLIGVILAILAPIMAVNSLISIFSSQQIQDQGGPIGSTTEGIIPGLLQSIIVFVLILGPLISIATQPAGFLELTLNSELYSTLSKFDWEEFNRKSDKARDIINVKPYEKRIMAGILAIFLSFIMYVAILAMGGISTSSDLFNATGLSNLSEALKFVEVPILLIVIFSILRNLTEEREVFDIAKLGRRENRDVTGWTFWVLQKIYSSEYEELLENFEELLKDEIVAKNHRLYFYRGLVEAHQFDYVKSEASFRKSMELEPNYADAVMEVGVVSYFQGKHREALKYLLRASKLKPRSKTIWYNLGRVYDVLDEDEKALEAYYKALKLDKNDAKTWANLAGPLTQLGRFDEAEKATRKALELDPSDFIAKVNLCSALLRQDKLEEYGQIITDLMETEGDNGLVLENLAQQKVLRNDVNSAHTMYARIVDLDIVNPFNIQGISMTFSGLGYQEELIEILEKHVIKYPEDIHSKLLMGQAYLKINRFADAVPYLEDYLAVEKEIPEAFTKLSASYANLQKMDDAYRILQEAISLFPEYPDINFNLGLTKSLLDHLDFDDNFAISLSEEYSAHYLNIWIQARNKVGTLNEQWLSGVIDQMKDKEELNTIYLGAANALVHIGNKELSLIYLDQIDQSTFTDLTSLGELYLELEEYIKAIDIFNILLKTNPSITVFNNLGVGYLRNNEVEKGLEVIIQGHNQFPEDTFLLTNITKIYLAMDNYQDAIPYYEKLIKLTPQDYVVLYEYATSQALVGNADQARELFGTSRNMASENNDDEMIAKVDEMLGFMDQPSEEN